jgi:hypothetical protein
LTGLVLLFKKLKHLPVHQVIIQILLILQKLHLILPFPQRDKQWPVQPPQNPAPQNLSLTSQLRLSPLPLFHLNSQILNFNLLPVLIPLLKTHDPASLIATDAVLV